MILVLNVRLTVFIHTLCIITNEKDTHAHAQARTFPFQIQQYISSAFHDMCLQRDIFPHKYTHNLNPDNFFDVIFRHSVHLGKLSENRLNNEHWTTELFLSFWVNFLFSYTIHWKCCRVPCCIYVRRKYTHISPLQNIQLCFCSV